MDFTSEGKSGLEGMAEDDVLIHLKNAGKTLKQPGLKALEKMVFSGIAKATDGCKVEPDGICSHGCESWLIKLGFI